MSTAVFSIAAALKTLLAGRSGLYGMHIATGPLGDTDPDEAIHIMRPRITRTPRTMTGRKLGGHDEDGTITVLVMVFRAGAGQTCIDSVRDRCKAICDEIEDAVGADPTIGSVAAYGAYVSSIAEQDYGIEPAPRAGHWMTAELTLTFKTRVYPGGIS